MKRARDVREQLIGLMQRVEMELVSNPTEMINIRKVSNIMLPNFIMVPDLILLHKYNKNNLEK